MNNLERTIIKVIENGVEYMVYEYTNGQRSFWSMDRKRHRVDEPAIEWVNGRKEWYLNNELIYCDKFDNTAEFDLTDKMKLSIFKYKLSK